jgi:hypothetical protein
MSRNKMCSHLVLSKNAHDLSVKSVSVIEHLSLFGLVHPGYRQLELPSTLLTVTRCAKCEP